MVRSKISKNAFLFLLLATVSILTTVSFTNDAYAVTSSVTKSTDAWIITGNVLDDFEHPEDAVSGGNDDKRANGKGNEHQAYGFPSFGIPTGSEILGIEALLEGKTGSCQTFPTNKHPRFSVQLSNPTLNTNPTALTNFIGDVKPTSDYGFSDSIKTVGGSSITWNVSPTVSQLNGNNFWVLVTSMCDDSAKRVELDHLQLKVYYTDDSDGDGILNNVDNCPVNSNSDQANNDGDSQGDLCDTDDDNDGILDNVDNCPVNSNSDQANNDGDSQGNACDSTPNGDTDSDGVDNATDNCPADSNTNQANNDGDSQGNACDSTPNGDSDNDGVDNNSDICAGFDDNLDTDTDGTPDGCDSTPNGDDTSSGSTGATGETGSTGSTGSNGATGETGSTGATGEIGGSDDTEVTNTETFLEKQGGGCTDCTPPILGYDSTGKKLVDGGFTYNGLVSDANYFFTPYPQITAEIGKENVAQLKIYEDSGPEQVRHVALGFGLAKGEYMSQSKAVIVYDIDFKGNAVVSQIDPENTIDDDSLRIEKETVKCTTLDVGEKCLLVTIYHTFRAPLEFNIVGTDIWDDKSNSWQNFFNHGIHIVGDSMNPPKEYDGINKGVISHLTETSKITAVDDLGNSWSLEYGVWNMDYKPVVRTDADIINDHKVWAIEHLLGENAPADMYSLFAYDRNHSKFAQVKDGQSLIAQATMGTICPECTDEPYDKINDIFAYNVPQFLKRSENMELIAKEKFEAQKALEMLMQIYGK